MSTKVIDATGMRCPQPIQLIITSMHETHPGDILEVTADCDTFEADVTNWANRRNKTLLAVTRDGDKVTAQILL